MPVVSLTSSRTTAGQRRVKKVPTLYEKDTSKYAGPHAWQVSWWAKLIRKAWHRRTYTRWVDAACSDLQVTGLEHLEQIPGPCIFVANHQSHLDTLVFHEVLPPKIRKQVFYGAAQDRWFVRGKKKMILKPWYQSLALGNFPILRGGGERALRYASWLLKRKQTVFLFPEGTRATSGELGEFKHGASILALEHDVPIVPVYLSGLKNIRPKGSQAAITGQAGVEILPPVVFSPGSDVAAATECIRRRMNRVHVAHMTHMTHMTHITKGDGAENTSGARHAA